MTSERTKAIDVKKKGSTPTQVEYMMKKADEYEIPIRKRPSSNKTDLKKQ